VAEDDLWMGGHVQGADAVRHRNIVRDIYARHRLPPGLPLDKAAADIQWQGELFGQAPAGGTPAWNNAQERAEARREYAARGQNWGEKQRLWDESKYLLPKDAQPYYQNYARDIDFLRDVTGAGRRAGGDMEGLTGDERLRLAGASMAAADGTDVTLGDSPKYLAGQNLLAALNYWDASNNSPLYRRDWNTGTYSRHGGVGNAVMNATTNPDTLAGRAFEFAEAGIPDRIRHALGGAESAGEAAQANYRLRAEHRPHLPVQILGIQSGADAQQKDSAIRRLIEQVSAAEPPSVRNSVYQRTGFDVGPFGGAVGEGVVSSLDGTQALALLGLPTSGVRAVARRAAFDTAQDAALSGGMSAGFAAGMPSEQGYFTAGFRRPDTMPSDEERVPPEVQRQVQREQAQMYRQDNAAGVSTADQSAYSRLMQGLAQPQYPRGYKQ
jgi:hypothetical protein